MTEVKKLDKRTVTIISIVGFAVVFAVLLALASIYDLQVSMILTRGSLPAGNYYSINQFGLFFEAFGATPIWLAIAVAGVIFFWNAPRIQNTNAKCNKRALAIFVMCLCAVVICVGFYFFMSDLLKYVFEHMGDKDYLDKGYVIGLNVSVSAVLTALLLFAWKNLGEERHKKLLWFALVIIFTAAFYLLITVIKSPVGRMRFRTMNALGDASYSGYTPWYVINGKRKIAGLPSDSCKSFPSGHTFSAGVIYVILALPDLFKKLNKTWVKVLLWLIAIGYTGVVAVSRIVVGAHYFSDVLFGGTIAFLAAMIAREIFVLKGEHFKSLFCKKKEESEVKTE
ncbi:MAG: phosphatase PAP2 family protein [Clostridiales bacterium]|nr:phosphatase PAP2 family protein [Clostridiales bacterium]